jgi:hypothetical protein
MKRLSTILWLLFIAHHLFAQRKSRNAPQSYLSIDIGVPIYNTTFAKFAIPIAIGWQRKKKHLGFGASVTLEYDKSSWGDCARRIPIGTSLRDVYPILGNLRAYCATYQDLGIKPALFGNYYLLENMKWHLWAKIGTTANINVLHHQEGEFYEIGTNGQVIKSEPIHISQNLETYKGIHLGLLSGLAANYALNKRTAFRFALQSEWYPGYLNNNRGTLLFVLVGMTTKI